MSILKRIIHGENYNRVCGVCAAPPAMSGFSADEQAKVERAWALAERAPNAHLLYSIRGIAKGNSDAGATALGDRITIDRNIALSEEQIACDIAHEAAHCHHGHVTSTPETERVAVEEENKARVMLGLPRKDPHDFSWHAANGYGVDYTDRSQPHPVIAPPPAPEPQQASVPWEGWESHDAYRRRMKAEKAARNG